MSEHDEDFKQPVVTDSPEFIWLQYGDIERDCTHHECVREGDVTWCEDSQFDSDVKYVRADLHETLRAELAAKEKALSSAKIALDAKDRSYSVIEQRFSAMAAKAATTDSERECNERLTAEIDALTAELAEARRQLKEASEQEPAAYCFASEIAQFNDEQFRIAQMHNRKCSNAEIALYTSAPVPQPAVPEAVAKDALRDVLASLDGIATVTPKYWEVPRDQFIDEFLPWAQSRARDSAKKLRAILSATDS